MPLANSMARGLAPIDARWRLCELQSNFVGRSTFALAIAFAKDLLPLANLMAKGIALCTPVLETCWLMALGGRDASAPRFTAISVANQ